MWAFPAGRSWGQNGWIFKSSALVAPIQPWQSAILFFIAPSTSIFHPHNLWSLCYGLGVEIEGRVEGIPRMTLFLSSQALLTPRSMQPAQSVYTVSCSSREQGAQGHPNPQAIYLPRGAPHGYASNWLLLCWEGKPCQPRSPGLCLGHCQRSRSPWALQGSPFAEVGSPSACTLPCLGDGG